MVNRTKVPSRNLKKKQLNKSNVVQKRVPSNYIVKYAVYINKHVP